MFQSAAAKDRHMGAGFPGELLKQVNDFGVGFNIVGSRSKARECTIVIQE